VPISIACECGRSLRVKDEAAGKKVRCPGCNAALAVPKPEPEAAPNVDDEAMNILMSEPARPAAAPAARRYSAPEPAGEPYAPRPSSPPPPPPPRPVFKDEPKRKSRRRESGSRGFSINPAIITGLLMMGGAVLWFVLGLSANRIFIYPPILFVLGLINVFRGFSGDAD
jgi:hypothetical protein